MLNRLTVSASTTEFGKLFQMLTAMRREIILSYVIVKSITNNLYLFLLVLDFEKTFCDVVLQCVSGL